MTDLTTNERLTLSLALEEYASGFALAMPSQECDAARHLAERIREAHALDLHEPPVTDLRSPLV